MREAAHDPRSGRRGGAGPDDEWDGTDPPPYHGSSRGFHASWRWVRRVVPTHPKGPSVSPLASYRRLFELAGTTYVVVAFLARLPLAMSQLGTLLLVSEATGSY